MHRHAHETYNMVIWYPLAHVRIALALSPIRFNHSQFIPISGSRFYTRVGDQTGEHDMVYPALAELVVKVGVREGAFERRFQLALSKCDTQTPSPTVQDCVTYLLFQCLDTTTSPAFRSGARPSKNCAPNDPSSNTIFAPRPFCDLFIFCHSPKVYLFVC